MNSKIPIPTDNIFKFTATFGLVLMISSLTLMILLFQNTNDVIFKNAKAIYDLDVSNRSDNDKKRRAELLKKEVDIAVSNRNIGKWFLAFLTVGGGFLSFVGFRQWYKKLQPMHDSLLELQLEKEKYEVKSLKKFKKK